MVRLFDRFRTRMVRQCEFHIFQVTDVNFALTIGMLKLRRRLRSARPTRRPMLDWLTLHVPIAPCLMGWRERIRR